MNSSLDMTLDDLIKSSKQPARGGGRGGGRGRGRGIGRGRGRGRRGGFGWASGGPLSVRRGTSAASTRPSSYQLAKMFSRTSDTAWQHDLFEDSLGPSGKSLGIETGTKLYISNLDFGVSNEDIKELFSEVGDLKRCAVHYDRSGRSKGTAEVLFVRRQDAIAAMKRYNNVQLDGKPMKIELIGTNLLFPYSQTTNGAGTTVGRGRRTVFTTRGRGRGVGFSRFRGRGRGRGRGGGRGRTPTAAELDKELEKYHTESMQTS